MMHNMTKCVFINSSAVSVLNQSSNPVAAQFIEALTSINTRYMYAYFYEFYDHSAGGRLLLHVNYSYFFYLYIKEIEKKRI